MQKSNFLTGIEEGDCAAVSGDSSGIMSFDSSDCFTFQIVKPGINTCNLAVKDGIGESKEEIKVENKITDVNIISNPELLIITDSEKLNQEFYQEPNAVKAVLKQAYASAENGNGVVYDLSWYKNELGINNQFASFINYFEKIIKPNMVDNSYSLAVSDFIKEKCEDCKDVMIVGDDFVVPGYRNEFKVDEIWFPFLNKINQHNIYTDQPYRMVTGIPQINELDLIFTQKGRVQDKQVMFIVPDEIDSELRGNIDLLKSIIQKNFSTNNIHEKKGSELIIGDYGVPGTTLVIIGNLENNPALRYYPFALSMDYDMWIDRNLWDPNRGFLQKEEYALILKIDSASQLNLHTWLIATQSYKKLNGEGINYLVVAGGALLVIASPFTGPFAPVVAVAGIAILFSDTIDNCIIENQAGGNWEECGINIAVDIATAGILKLVKPLAEPLVKKFGKAVGEKIITLINKLGQHIDPKAISKVAKEGDELVNMKYMADGSGILSKNSDNSLGKAIQELPKNLDQPAKARFVKNLGEISAKYGDEVADDVAKLSDVGGVDKLAGNIAEQGGGFPFEAKVGRILRGRGEELVELSGKIPNSEFDVLTKRGINEAKDIDWTKHPIGSESYNGIKNKLGNQISAFREFDPTRKITIFFKGDVEAGIKDWLVNTKNVYVEVVQ